MTRVLRVVLMVFVTSGVFVVSLGGTAHACSCVEQDPLDSLKASDGAFVGTVAEAPDDDGDPWVFDVEAAYKGDLGDEVEVEAPKDGAACGFEVQPKQRLGVFLERKGSGWESGLCSQVAAIDLQVAARAQEAMNDKPTFTWGAIGVIVIIVAGAALAIRNRFGRDTTGEG